MSLRMVLTVVQEGLVTKALSLFLVPWDLSFVCLFFFLISCFLLFLTIGNSQEMDGRIIHL